jgi:hypothetical protein
MTSFKKKNCYQNHCFFKDSGKVALVALLCASAGKPGGWKQDQDQDQACQALVPWKKSLKKSGCF